MSGNPITAVTRVAPPPSAIGDLKRAATTLEPAALDELYQHVITLRALSSGQSRSANVPVSNRTNYAWEERALYEALATSIAKMLNANSVMPWERFRKTWIYARFTRAAAVAIEQHRAWLPRASRLESLSMLRLYAVLTLSYLQADAHVIGWKSVCWALENLPLIVDQHFPNYAQSGLLSAVANIRTKPLK